MFVKYMYICIMFIPNQHSLCIFPSYHEEEEKKWMDGVSLGLSHKLKDMVLVSSTDTHVLKLHIASFAQVKTPNGQLSVNFDPALHDVISEAHHLSRPPLSVRMPPVIKSLMKGMNEEELHDRRSSLELVMQVYRDLQSSMKDEERLLLYSKLQQIDTVSIYTCSATLSSYVIT